MTGDENCVLSNFADGEPPPVLFLGENLNRYVTRPNSRA